MKQKLTSRFPLFVRALVLTLSALPFWVAVLYVVPHSTLLEWRPVAIWVAIFQLLFVCILILLLKDVWIDENYIYLATLFKKSQAPLEAVISVTEDSRHRATLIEIIFAQTTDIGARLSFTPYFSFSFFKPHPVVDEINRLAIEKKQRMERYNRGLPEVWSH